MAHDRFTFSSAGQIHELELAMDRASGWNAALVKLMCQGDHMVHIREYLLGQAEIKYLSSAVIPINRLTPFNPAEFLGKDWSIWRGSANGDGLSGEEELDERSLAITELNLSQVQLVTCLNEGEERIAGEERLERLKENNFIRLDANVFLTLWQNQHLIPEVWKKKTNTNTTYIFFNGTTLRSPLGRRCVLALYWDDGGWRWSSRWLERGWDGSHPSAVLASLPAAA